MRKILRILSLKNIVGFTIVAIIFFFLGKILIDNWHKVKDYQFSFNYWCLILSFLLFFSGNILMGLIWNIALRALNSDRIISYWEATRITIYTNLGKYIPGKVWTILGAIYMGSQQGLPKQTLTVSYTTQTIISAIAALFWGSLLVLLFFGKQFSFLYYVLLLLIPLFVIVLQPKFLFSIIEFAIKKIKKLESVSIKYFTVKQVIMLFLLLSTMHFFYGTGFYFLVSSITALSFNVFLPIIGIYLLANISGFIVIFAPGGLGVREGVIVLLLQLYFPLSITVLISLLARLWATLGDFLLFLIIYIFNKYKAEGINAAPFLVK